MNRPRALAVLAALRLTIAGQSATADWTRLEQPSESTIPFGG